MPSGKVAYDTGAEGSLIQRLRFDLTPDEIERHKLIGRDASVAMEEAAMRIMPGMSEYEVAADIMASMEKNGFEILSCMVAADERISLYRHRRRSKTAFRSEETSEETVLSSV